MEAGSLWQATDSNGVAQRQYCHLFPEWSWPLPMCLDSLLPLTSVPTSLGKASISFGSMSRQFAFTLLGCQNNWLSLTAVQPWKCAAVSPVEACTTCRNGSPISSIPRCSQTFIILGIPKVPKNWKSFYACSEKGWGCAVESSVLTAWASTALVNSSLQHSSEVCNWNWDCLLWEWGTKGTTNRPLAASPTRRWTRSSYLEWYCVCWSCAKDVQDWLSAACLEPAKLVQLLPFWRGHWSLIRASILMVLTKENVAAHAVAEHLVSLQLPDRIQGKMWRLVRDFKQNRKGSCTPLDILPSKSFDRSHSSLDAEVAFNRNVASRMSSIDLFLEDEGQQYGNMEEATSVARIPATCLEVWSGDHRQNTWCFGRNSPSAPWLWDAKLSILKLMIWGVLPCDIWTGSEGSFRKSDNSWKTTPLPSILQLCLIGEAPPCFSREIRRAAFAILWMGLRGERKGLPSMLATSFAAGVAGRQKWGLVLSTSAWVSQLTRQTILLVRFNGTSWNFRKFVIHENPRRGGVLLVFKDVPRLTGM